MRVLINGNEVGGLIRDLATEFSSRGCEVCTISDSHRFYDFRYDYNQTQFVMSYVSQSLPSGVCRLVLPALWHAGLYQRLERSLRCRLARRFDFYIQVCGGAPYQKEILSTVKQAGIPSAVLLMGTDVRDYRTFVKQYDVGDWVAPPEYLVTPTSEKRRILKEVESLASAIFSVPDQMGLAERPYYHLQIPLRLDKFKPHIPGRTVPRVLHAPSNSSIKGTKIIEETLKRLQDEGVAHEYVKLAGVKHEEVLPILSDVDVVVDELILHGPGWLSFEGMASGCAVATRYLENSPACFRPPVVSIDHHTIYFRLKELLSNRQMRIELAEKSIEFVKSNAIGKVLDEIVARATRPDDFAPDYIPDSI